MGKISLKQITTRHQNSDGSTKSAPWKLGKGVRAGRRNPGRNDGYTWNGSNFVCGSDIDGGGYGIEEDYPHELECSSGDTHAVRYKDAEIQVPSLYDISLGDIAKPERKKKKVATGPAREFEMVDSVQRVIVLDDFELGYEERVEAIEDEWESIEREDKIRPLYSAILAGTPG
ncbi:hypothetical protein SCP_1700440 [Sparassis crispa]|uniref:Uncharacterized protein n=1 Tax=Sparassis crispa TaxID=139825 RepID=A0A401H5T3_9APHY|nr:hypothetical protein SCP_1700440 [Sparassis crispa]GBE89720.1 hypothetical protein SCP_1700440 [Sparassis crispa]